MQNDEVTAIKDKLEDCSLRMYTYANHFNNLMSRFGGWTGEHYNMLQSVINVSPQLFDSMEHSIGKHRELLEEFQETVIDIASVSADYVTVLSKIMELYGPSVAAISGSQVESGRTDAPLV